MATNFGKRVWRLVAQEAFREKALQTASELSQKSAHRWIPAESLQKSGYGEMTERQALWLHFYWKRNQIEADFEPATILEQSGQ